MNVHHLRVRPGPDDHSWYEVNFDGGELWWHFRFKNARAKWIAETMNPYTFWAYIQASLEHLQPDTQDAA